MLNATFTNSITLTFNVGFGSFEGQNLDTIPAVNASSQDHVRFPPKADKYQQVSVSPLCADFVAEVAEERGQLRLSAEAGALTCHSLRESGGWGLL
jgi:hypothetical protein